MHINVDEIIKINNQRNKERNKEYNPITGEGSDTCDRMRFYCEGITDTPIMLPIWAFADKYIDALAKARSVEKYCAQRDVEYNDYSLQECQTLFHNHRIKYDFEYWGATDVTITDLLSETEVKFILNPAQRELLKEFYDDWYHGRPVRFIIVKGRQNGFSTEIEMLFGWIQIVTLKHANSVICAHIENTAKIIRGMYNLMIKKYPIEHTPNGIKLELTPYEGSTKTRIIKQVQSRLSIGSAEKPDSLVGDKITLVHFSEVGLYKTTEGITPAQLVQSILSGVQHRAHTCVFYESTARGVGNFFHKEWLRAVNGLSDFRALFFPWFRNHAYSLPIANYKKFINSLTKYEYGLFKMGATLEGINWRRKKKKEYEEEWRFMQDFPSTVEEAFTSTGHGFYPIEDVERLRKGCSDPKFVGDIYGDDVTGKDTLENMSFHEEAGGKLSVWDFPDEEKAYANRYVVVMDIGGTTGRGDSSDILVIDRKDMTHGGLPVVCAEWHGNCDYDILAWKGAQIATMYDKALLVIESNTFEKNKVSGDNFEYILDEIADSYSNLYSRTPVDRVKEGLPLVWGFHTNSKTKSIVCNHMKKVLRENMYIERCHDAVDECATFEVKTNKNGREVYEAREGCHDDRHITRAIGIWISYSEMPLPRLRTKINKKTKAKTKKVGLSSF